MSMSRNLRSERYIGVLLVEIFKEKRYVAQGSEKKKAVINISSVEYRLERRRTNKLTAWQWALH